jgi:hydroxypyruvate isomerase
MLSALDAPDRHASSNRPAWRQPWDGGEINYSFLFRFSDAMGYRGRVGCEHKPATMTVESRGWHAALAAET